MRKVAGAGALRVSHEKWRGVKREDLAEDDEFIEFAASLEAACHKNADLRATLGVEKREKKGSDDDDGGDDDAPKSKAQRAPAAVLSPVDVREIFAAPTRAGNQSAFKMNRAVSRRGRGARRG